MDTHSILAIFAYRTPNMDTDKFRNTDTVSVASFCNGNTKLVSPLADIDYQAENQDHGIEIKRELRTVGVRTGIREDETFFVEATFE
jgi:hypothetical protein